MWKASARSGGRSSSEAKRDGQRDGGAAPQVEINDQLLIGKEFLASIASHGLGPTIVEEKQGFFKGGKFLKALMRNFHVSSRSRSSSRTSSDEHSSVDDPNENGRNNGRTQAEETFLVGTEASSVYQLQEELQTLRQRLDKEQEEMQKLRSEVSLLRLAGSNGNVQRQSYTQAGPHVDSGSLVGRNDSIRSDVSQLSCLDFSLAPTGMLKFEGELRAKITPFSQPQLGSKHQMDSFLADAAAASPVRMENLSKGNKVGHQLDVQSAAKSNTLIMVHKHEHVEEQVDDTAKKNLDGSTENSCEPDYVEKYCHDHIHTDADLKFVETITKSTDVQMLTPSSISDAEESLFSTRTDHTEPVRENSNSSRSPPKSICSTEEQDVVAFSSIGQKADSDLDDSVALQKAAPFKESNGNFETASPKSSDVAANLKLVEKFSVMEMQYQDLEEETLKVTRSNARKVSPKTLGSNAPGRINRHAHTIFKPSVELSIDCSSAMEEILLEETGKNSISRSQGASRARDAPLQGTRLFLNITADSDTSRGGVTSSAESDSLSKAQSRSTAAYSLATEEIPRKKISSNNRFSSRRSRAQVVERGVVSEPAKVKSEFSRAEGAAFSESTMVGSRQASLDLDRGLDQESSREDNWYPELELEICSRPMHTHRGEKTLTNLKELDLTTRSAPGSPRRPVVAAELPRRSLDSQAMSESFSDQSRAVLRPWNINYKGDVQSRAVSMSHNYKEPMAARKASDVENFQLRESRTYSGSVSSRYSATEVSNSPMVGPGHDRFSQSWSSPSRSSRARGCSPLRKSESKSGRGDDSIWQTPSSDFTTVRSAGVEELNIEEEVRRCLEQSRKLLLSDATTRCSNSSIEDDHSCEEGPRLLEKSFSVLALSRQRRSMERNRSATQNKQNQERQEPVMYEEKKFNQSRNADNGREEAKEEDDYSIVISPRRLREAVASWDNKKRETRENNRQSTSPQPVASWDDKKRETREDTSQSISHQPLRSQRSRSRFYLEANPGSPRASITSPISTDLYRIS